MPPRRASKNKMRIVRMLKPASFYKRYFCPCGRFVKLTSKNREFTRHVPYSCACGRLHYLRRDGGAYMEEDKAVPMSQLFQMYRKTLENHMISSLGIPASLLAPKE
jgi:hypothetical protein